MSAQVGVWVLTGLLVIGAAVVLLSWKAGRLDRMHIRLATAHASLETQLADRAARALAVATSGLLDPASSLVLLSAAEAARPLGEQGGPASQSALSQDIRAVLPDQTAVDAVWAEADELGRELLRALAAACDRVRLARGFRDDLVLRTQQQRRQVVARWFHLAGHAPWPAAEPFDDQPPAALLETAAHGRPML